MGYDHILYEVEDGIAWVTINRPERMNSFNAHTVEELISAFKRAWAYGGVGVVVLTGAGDRAFCAGGDQKQMQETGDYGPSESGLFEIETLHRLIRDIPKPVIAAVNGVAVGGGNVLQVLCDLSIAASSARFAQVGPAMGSFDAGFGGAYLARLVGERKAREIWFLCRQYSADEALAMGLVNAVVPPERLREEARAWAREILAKSPTALAFMKHSMNSDTEGIAGVGRVSFEGLHLYLTTEESKEAGRARSEKRQPRFDRFRP